MRMRIFAALGALAAAMMVMPEPAAAQQQPTTVRVCTGSAAGNYTFAANEVAKRLGNQFRVEIINTNGSLDNLRRMQAGDCDMGFSQSDVQARFMAENAAATTQMRTFMQMYREYVHLICPATSGWSRINDVGKAARDGKPARIIVGPEGSGAAESWRAMRQADPGLYDRVERIPESVGRASLAQVRDSRDTCVLWISGLNSPDMVVASSMSAPTPNSRGIRMQLLDFDDRDIRNLRGPDGQALYDMQRIVRVPAATNNPGRYSNLIVDGWGEDSVNVATVRANLLIREDFRRSLGSRADTLVQAIDDAMPTINARVNPVN